MRTSVTTAFLVVTLSAGLLGSSAVPAGAASGARCKNLVGKVTFKPPLPRGTGKVALTVSITNAKLSSCTGSGGTHGSLSFTGKPSQRVGCESASPDFVKGTETIKWANGTTSSVSAALGFADRRDFNGPVKSGAMAGGFQKATVRYAAPKSACRTTSASFFYLGLAKGKTFAIK